MHKGTLTNWGSVGIFAKENIPNEVCHEFDLKAGLIEFLYFLETF